MTTEPPCVIDIEASGFGRASYPIEIGVALPDGHGLCTLVRPPSHWTHWDPKAEAVHGIARDTACRFGRSAADVARWLNEALRGLRVYSDGWGNDYSWLGLLFDEAGCLPDFRLEHLRSLIADDEAERFAPLCETLRAGMQLDRHRASNDARVLQLAVERLRAERVAGNAREGT